MQTPSQNPYTLNRFFQHLREAVMFFPDSGNINLQTFAYVNDIDDFNKPNLGYDIKSAKSDYCLSKMWEKKKQSTFEFKYPILAAQELQHEANDLIKISSKSQKLKHKIRLRVLDVYNDQKDSVPTSKHRELPDYYRDSEKILIYVLSYFKNIHFCKVTNLDTSTTYGYYNTLLLAQMVTDNLITSYISATGELSQVDMWFRTMLEKSDILELGIEESTTGNKLVGCYVDVIIETWQCLNPAFDFTFTSNDFIYGSI